MAGKRSMGTRFWPWRLLSIPRFSVEQSIPPQAGMSRLSEPGTPFFVPGQPSRHIELKSREKGKDIVRKFA
jgi:hypothetical protein